MGITLRIQGAIDRQSPDPSAPHDPLSTWIGMVQVAWLGGERRAAILKAATGRGGGDARWGQNVMLLRWIGDPPPPEIAQSVYDVIQDGGPDNRVLSVVIDSQPRTVAQPSYRQQAGA